MSITPGNCIQCKLCQDSCPFDAIDSPSEQLNQEQKTGNKKRFTIYALLIPIWILIGGFAMNQAHSYLSKAHPDVYLAELLIQHPELKNDKNNLDIQTFLSSEKSMDQLVNEAKVIQQKYYTGSWIFGGFLGLVIGVMLMNQFVTRRRESYEPNKVGCYSCGRCMKNCPIKQPQTPRKGA